MAPEPARRRRFIAAAVLLPVAVAALAEIVLRVFDVGRAPDTTAVRFLNPEGIFADEADSPICRDPTLFWRLRPNWSMPGSTQRTGRTGFRSDFDVAKATGVRRVACLGDSNTFGAGVEAAQTWPGVLGAELSKEGGGARSEVLNLGVPGYTSWQVRRLVETELGRYAPDVVVVECGGFNEWVPAVDASDRAPPKRPAWTSLRIVALLSSAAKPDVDYATASSRLRGLATADLAGPRRVSPAEFEDDLLAIAAWCAAHGARVVFLVHPLPAETVRRNPIVPQYADVVRRVAMATHAPLADGWAEFKRTGLSDDALFIDFCHPRPAAHAVLARAVKDALAR